MRTRKWFLCCLILICSVFTACGKEEERKLQVVFKYRGDYWNAFDLSGSVIPNQEKFEELAQNYIQKAEKLLGNYGWWEKINPEADTLILYLTISGKTETVSSSGYGGKGLDNEVMIGVSLSGNALMEYHSDAALAHELTHIMVGPSFSLSLEEGLCQYVQATIGVTSQMPWIDENRITFVWVNENRSTFEQYFKTYHEYFKTDAEEAAQKLQDIIDSVGNANRQYPKGKKNIWMLYSESFVRYLMSQYGVDRTMELITAGEGESAYEEILGKNLTELKEEWISSVEALEQQYTLEEIKKIESEFLLK